MSGMSATETTDPGANALDPAVVDANLAADPTPAVDPAPEPELAPAPEPKKTPWYMSRISEESEKANRADQRAREAEQKANDLAAMLARLQAGEKPPAQPAPVPQPHQRQPEASSQDYQAAVKAEAAKMRFYDDTAAIRDAGLAKFSNFGDTINILTAVGATSNEDFLADVIAVDKAGAHILLDKLAKEPERAGMLARMDSRARVAELTRMAMAENQTQPAAAPAAAPKPATSVSKAPPPKPQLDPASSNPDSWLSDDATDDQFFQGWKKKYGM